MTRPTPIAIKQVARFCVYAAMLATVNLCIGTAECEAQLRFRMRSTAAAQSIQPVNNRRGAWGTSDTIKLLRNRRTENRQYMQSKSKMDKRLRSIQREISMLEGEQRQLLRQIARLEAQLRRR